MSTGEHQAAALASGQFMKKERASGPATLKKPLEPYVVPMNFDPRALAHIDGYEEHGAYVKPALEALTAAHDGLRRVDELRKKAHYLGEKGAWTSEQQVLQIAKEASKLQDAILRKFDAAHKQLSDGIRGTAESLNAPIQGRADTTISRAVWDHVKALPNDKRHSFITDRIEKGDARSIETILSAPGYLSGLDDNFIETYTKMWHAKTQPQLAGRLRVMKEALEIAAARGSRVATEMEGAMRCKWSRIQEMTSAQADIQQTIAQLHNL